MSDDGTEGSGEDRSGTEPVYITKSLKKRIKYESVSQEVSMGTIADRMIVRGFEAGFHEDPLTDEELEELDGDD